MKVAVIGGGGREHAIVKSLKKNSDIDALYCIPGNGGIASEALCVDISATDIDGVVSFCVDNGIDFTAVIPDDPLALGLVDRLEEKGIRCFGPSAKAAEIESSKVFAKGMMRDFGIPTAKYEVFSDAVEAKRYIEATGKYPTVIKADGLALGKGVIIAENRDEAFAAIDKIMVDLAFGKSGSRVVVEEFLTGPEVSVLSFTDGKTIVPMVSSMDHKRALDGDKGLNTGGMGTIAPNPFYTPAIQAECMEKIFIPTVRAMNSLGREFKGCLYFGLMITEDGPKVIEYNCRFGDPETQVVLPLLKTDLFEIMKAVREERLSEIDIEFSEECACCVIAASGGYPGSYKKGIPINIEKDLCCDYFHAGTALKNDGTLVTSGGRVLGVTATAPTLEQAVSKVYDGISHVSFDGMFYRRDIGKRAINAALK